MFLMVQHTNSTSPTCLWQMASLQWRELINTANMYSKCVCMNSWFVYHVGWLYTLVKILTTIYIDIIINIQWLYDHIRNCISSTQTVNSCDNAIVWTNQGNLRTVFVSDTRTIIIIQKTCIQDGLEIVRYMFNRYYMHRDICNMFNYTMCYQSREY